jgi:replication factor C small subunit
MVTTSKEHTLFVEKYRSKVLDEYVGNQNIKLTVAKYLEQNDIQNLIFYGPPGTGKTTLAKLIVNNLDCDYLYINASDERGIETIRDKVSGFASSASFKPLKVIILDEADFLTIQAQASLRNVIETYSRSTRFILTCNYVERIIDPLQSRCQVLKIVPPSKAEVAAHIAAIMDKENIVYDLKDLKVIVNQFYPDLRKCLNTVQLSIKEYSYSPSYPNEKVLDIDQSVIVSSQYTSQVINELKTTKDWKKIRQIIADSNVNDYEELYKELYSNMSHYADGREGLVVIILEEYQYHANFRIDKEINIMACIAKIIQTL